MYLPVPTVTFSLLLFAFGTILGSFLNVVTLRYTPEGRLFSLADTRGRSHCPHCRKTLAWYELIPFLSFFAQRGRCRSCHARLSLQYPAVECAAGLLVFGIPTALIHFWSISPQLFFLLNAPVWSYVLAALWTLLALLLLVLFVIDLRHLIIPNGLNLSIGIVGLFITLTLALFVHSLPMFDDSFLSHYQLLFTIFQNVLLNHLLGAAVGGALFYLLHLIARGRAMGLGDVKLAAALGLALGWPDIGVAIALSFILGGAWGAVALLSRRRRFGDRVPFGPFLVLGALLTITLGSAIVGWYFSFFTA